MIKNDLRDNPDYSKFVFFDLETSRSGDVLDCGVWFQNSYTVMGLSELLKFITSFKDGTFVAHFGSGFDFLFLIDGLLEYGYEIKYAVSGSSGIAMFCTKGKSILRFIDSFRIASVSLKKFSESFAPETQKIALNMLPEDLKSYDRSAYYEYLERDVIALKNSYFTFMNQFSEYKLGKNPPITAASLAMKVFKNHLGDRVILTSSKKTREYERKSYFGGVCYISEPCNREVNIYDINSMYPYVMQSSDFPVSYVGHWCERFNSDYQGLWYCSITEDYPGLPFTFEVENRTLSRSGCFILDRETILYFQSKNVAVDIHYGYQYLRSARLFEYYSELYNQRLLAQQQGETGKAFALKIILNSLYGKFGQKDEGKTIVSYSQAKEKQLLADNIPFNTDSRFIMFDEYREAKTAFPAIASLVTLRARLLLRKLSDGVDVIYADTDSLHIPIEQTLPTSTDLGALKLEYSGRAVYIAKKLYTLLDTGKMVHKGVPKGCLTIDDYFGMLDYRDIRVDYYSLPTVNDVLGKGIKPGISIPKHRTLRRLS